MKEILHDSNIMTKIVGPKWKVVIYTVPKTLLFCHLNPKCRYDSEMVGRRALSSLRIHLKISQP